MVGRLIKREKEREREREREGHLSDGSERRDRVEGMFNECGHVVTRDSRATGDVPTFSLFFPSVFFF